MVMEREKYMFVYSYLIFFYNNNKLPIAYAVLSTWVFIHLIFLCFYRLRCHMHRPR